MARLKRRLKLEGVYKAMYLFLRGEIDEVKLETAINESTQSSYFDVDDKIKDGYIGVFITQDEYLKIMNVDDYNQTLINKIGNSYNYNYEDDPSTIAQDLINGYIFRHFNKKDFEELQEYFKLSDRAALGLVNQILDGDVNNDILGKLGERVNKFHKKLMDIIVEEYQSYHERAVEAAGDAAIQEEMCGWLSQIPTAVWVEDSCPEHFYMKMSEILN